MNWLDLAIIVAVVFSALLGLKIGIIKAVLSLVGLIVGVILAGCYYEILAEQSSHVGNITRYLSRTFSQHVIEKSKSQSLLCQRISQVHDGSDLLW